MPSCSISPYCLYNTGNPSINDIYYSAGTHNSNTYYTGSSNSYFIYYSTTGTSWCLSTALNGACILFGKSPCTSDCPDLCDTYFFSGACPTPTPTPTVNCNSFDFDSIFDCAVTPSPTVTPSITPTISITPSPSSTVFCPVGINASISAYTPTPTVTPSITPTSSSPVVRDCVVSGDVIFNTVDTVLVCQSSSRFQDCYNGFDYYTTTVSTQPNGSPITEFMIFQATVDGERRCISYVGQNNTIIGANNITLTTNVIGYVNLGQCIECIGALTQTPTPTPTITPTNTPTPSVTSTPFKTPSPTSSVSNLYYLYKNCKTNDYVLQQSPAILITVGDAMYITLDNPTITSIKKGQCWTLVSSTSTYPSINPTWNLITSVSNVFTAVSSVIYDDCSRCEIANSGGSSPSVSQSPTPTKTNTPTPTRTPTRTPTPTPSSSKPALQPVDCRCSAIRNTGFFPKNLTYVNCAGETVTVSVLPSVGPTCICYDANYPLNLNGLTSQPCDGGGGLVFNGCCDQVDCC